MSKTITLEKSEVINKNTQEILKKIANNLEERGYDSIKQIAGYLISGDPGYISNYKESRNQIIKLNRQVIIEHMKRERCWEWNENNFNNTNIGHLK